MAGLGVAALISVVVWLGLCILNFCEQNVANYVCNNFFRCVGLGL
jgi:hypothetical protein